MNPSIDHESLDKDYWQHASNLNKEPMSSPPAGPSQGGPSVDGNINNTLFNLLLDLGADAPEALQSLSVSVEDGRVKITAGTTSAALYTQLTNKLHSIRAIPGVKDVDISGFAKPKA